MHLKLFLDHSQFLKPQEGVEKGAHVTRILLMWTAQAALHPFSFSTKTSTQRAW